MKDYNLKPTLVDPKDNLLSELSEVNSIERFVHEGFGAPELFSANPTKFIKCNAPKLELSAKCIIHRIVTC